MNHFTDTYTPQVEAFFEQVDPSVELWVPEFCLLEYANVVWKEAHFRGMPHAQAEALINDLIALPLRVVPVSEALPRALRLGLSYGLPIYDSVYIAMAERMGISLVTVDSRQATAAVDAGVTLTPITDFAVES